MKKFALLFVLSLLFVSCKTMDVAQVSNLNKVAVIGLSVSDVDDSQISQRGNIVTDMLKKSATAMTSDEDIWDGKTYRKVIHDSIFRQNLPYRLAKENIVLRSSTYRSIKSITSKEDSGMFAVSNVHPYPGYKVILNDNMMANSSVQASNIAKELKLDGTLDIKVSPVLMAHSRGFVENLVSVVSPVDLESIYVAANIQFDLYNKEGKKISTYTANGISKTELKAVSGIYNAKDVKARLLDAVNLAFVDYMNFYKEKGVM
ncbi:hypothetical protein [uncultured Ilyobacter sp.]|uniref:hypothetical protein n=1 Tax=uncultured Ilyobacter sp. TaxID=544433 RepID=UPI002AA70502|nr:hypothetical protein [uncultured Ilyobacter sp.]